MNRVWWVHGMWQWKISFFAVLSLVVSLVQIRSLVADNMTYSLANRDLGPMNRKRLSMFSRTFAQSIVSASASRGAQGGVCLRTAGITGMCGGYSVEGHRLNTRLGETDTGVVKLFGKPETQAWSPNSNKSAGGGVAPM